MIKEHIPERYNKYAVSPHASDDSTDEPSFVTMDVFRDSMATSIALAWNQCNSFYYYEPVIKKYLSVDIGSIYLYYLWNIWQTSVAYWCYSMDIVAIKNLSHYWYNLKPWAKTTIHLHNPLFWS